VLAALVPGRALSPRVEFGGGALANSLPADRPGAFDLASTTSRLRPSKSGQLVR
jgi:hypothetical protein